MLRIIQLSKRYGRRVVLSNLNFAVDKGIAIIRGPNGSGKSTLLRIIAGIERPTSGRVEIDGNPPQESRESISYLGHRTGLYPNMTVEENLRLFSHLYGKVPFERYVEMFRLREYMSFPLRKLSRGNLQKVGLIRAIMKEANVYLLDEPSTALDKNSKEVLLNLIEELKERIVLIASHEDMGIESDAEINL